jgi:hypothetical protein
MFDVWYVVRYLLDTLLICGSPPVICDSRIMHSCTHTSYTIGTYHGFVQQYLPVRRTDSNRHPTDSNLHRTDSNRHPARAFFSHSRTLAHSHTDTHTPALSHTRSFTHALARPPPRSPTRLPLTPPPSHPLTPPHTPLTPSQWSANCW